MTISDRTRKILWVRAAGRCAMCRQMLATEEQSADDPSVFGEEAHIVGRSANGPRGGEVVPDVFLDSITDWTDVVGGVGVSHSAKRDAIKGLTSGILELAQYGLIVGGRRRHCLMVGGDAEPQAILGADIEVQPFEALQMAHDNAHPYST